MAVCVSDDDVACPLLYTPYHEVATAYGGDGIEVSDPEKDDVKQALAIAQQRARDGIPMCVNARIGQTDFRKGSLSV